MNYKSISPVNRKVILKVSKSRSDNENVVLNVDAKNILKKFDEKFDSIKISLASNDITNATQAINDMDEILKASMIENLVDNKSVADILIETNIFQLLLNYVDSPIQPCAMHAMKLLSKSSEVSMIKLLQFGFLDNFNDFLLVDDQKITNNIISIYSEIIRKSFFLTCLVYSTGIIHHITQLLLNEPNELLLQIASHLICVFCENTVFGCQNMVELYNRFSDECVNKEIYNFDLFTEFNRNGISLEDDMPFKTLFNICLRDDSIYNLYLIYHGACCLLSKDYKLNVYFFSGIDVYQHTDYYLMLLLSKEMDKSDKELFFEEFCEFIKGIFYYFDEKDDQLPYQIIDAYFDIAKHAFQIKSEDLICKSTDALFNIVESDRRFAEELIDDKFLNLMNEYIKYESFRVQKKILFLLMTISRYNDEIMCQKITPEEIDFIVTVLTDLDNNFILNILNVLKILLKNEIHGNKLIKSLKDSDIESSLYELMDYSDDKNIRYLAEELDDIIYSKTQSDIYE